MIEITGHTPGPWRINPGFGTDVVGPSYEIIAMTCGSRRVADARLIALVPDLLRENAELRAQRDALLSAVKVARKQIDLFCTRTDAVAASVFNLIDAAVARTGEVQ